MNWLFHHNNFIPSGEFIIQSSNRSFRYGDGLFETIRVSVGTPVFIDLHIQRLLGGMQLLGIHIPQNWDVDFFKDKITQLAVKNEIKNAKCRLTVWRGGAGLYKPETNDPEILIELSELETADYILNKDGLLLGVFDEVPKLIHPLSAFKTANALVYVLAAKYAAEQNYGDVVVMNNEGRIADTINSNLFIYRDRQLFTPSANEGGVDGVMRKVVISVCRKEGILVNEISMDIKELESAEEIFLSNAINGIKWVGSFRDKKYENKFATDLIYILNEQKDSNTLVSA